MGPTIEIRLARRLYIVMTRANIIATTPLARLTVKAKKMPAAASRHATTIAVKEFMRLLGRGR